MLVYGRYECFVMQMLYVCVLWASCSSSQYCILHDFPFVNAGCCCCSPFSLVYLSLVFPPRDSRVPGLRPQVCSISPTVSLSLDELGN